MSRRSGIIVLAFLSVMPETAMAQNALIGFLGSHSSPRSPNRAASAGRWRDGGVEPELLPVRSRSTGWRSERT